MFERFTEAARGVVVDAQEQARSMRHQEVRAEHLLLAIVAAGTSPGAGVLRDLGVDEPALAAEVASHAVSDDEALRAIGVDLTAVRQQAEATFGPGALDQPRRRRRGLLDRVPWRGGHLRFDPGARRALEQALRQAMALKHHDISADHLLLGLLADDHGPASLTLQRLGVSPSAVRTRVREVVDTAA